MFGVDGVIGFLEDAGRRIQGTELFGFDRHRRRTGLLNSGLLGGFLGAAGPGAFLRSHDSSPLGSRTSHVATIAMRVRRGQLPRRQTDLKMALTVFSRIFFRSMFQPILDQAGPEAPLLVPVQGAG